MAAIVLTSQYSGAPTLADALLLPAIAAVVVGGTAITGGIGGPPPAPSALLRHPRVLATPHIGGFTGASVRRATAQAVDNLMSVLVTE